MSRQRHSSWNRSRAAALNALGVLLLRLIHTGRRCQRLSLTVNGVTSSVAELNYGSVALQNWIMGPFCFLTEVKNFSTFQAPMAASANQIALCKYPSADASQSRSCNTRKVCDWLLSLWRRVSTKLQTHPPSSVDAPCEWGVTTLSENRFRRLSACGRKLNKSFKLIREPIHWFANWFDQAFEQNWLKRMNHSRMGIAHCPEKNRWHVWNKLKHF